MSSSLRHILCAVSAAFLLSLPWLGIFPAWVLLFALFPILLLEDELSQNNRGNPYLLFNYLFLSFWLWHLFTVWWVIKVTVWGILFLSIMNASCMSFVWWLFHRMKQKCSLQFAYIALIALWLSFEFLHHRWEIEWPWLCLGNGLASQHKIVQWYEYTGMLGGTLWILISNMLVFSIWKKIKSKNFVAIIARSFLWLLVIFIPIFWSLNRYNNYKEEGDHVEITLLQPNINPFTEKFSGLSAEEQLEKLLHLSDSLVTSKTDFVIGPETCLPQISEDAVWSENPFIRPFMERAKQNNSLNFILGAMTRKNCRKDSPLPVSARFDENANQWYQLFNSALKIDSSSVQVYHKSILVAGVEKMPFQRYFKFLKNHSLDLGGTTGSLGTQAEPGVFKSNYTIGPVICFESIFGQYLSRIVKKGAEFFVVITNDGWLQSASGYSQHLDVARIRAIESRRSIARSANTGISALINQRGDIISKTGWSEETGLRGTIQTNKQVTFYVRYGDFIGRIAAFVATLLLLYFIAQVKSQKKV
ncbi:apolipoprotein N-acyltransferase [Mangrovibacterium lignilyticum]|uniref:apolipoprotein N-acyltransferase n=1 Tax=Mangrovibacterium lignilyticum TaxID=2668052 RepID=UPI0013D4C560|nr:apolipoprotein N-acyltransferase [Mangrovibacterium lignilyticum]